MRRFLATLTAIFLAAGCAHAQPPTSSLPAVSTPSTADYLTLSQACATTATGYCSRKLSLAQLLSIVPAGNVTSQSIATALGFAPVNPTTQLLLAGGKMTGPLVTASSLDAESGAFDTLACGVANCPGSSAATSNFRQLSNLVVNGVSGTDPNKEYFNIMAGLISNGGWSSTGVGGGSQNVSIYAGAVQGPNGGPTWAFNTDLYRGATCASGTANGLTRTYVAAKCTLGQTIAHNVGTFSWEMDHDNVDRDIPPASPYGLSVGIFANTANSFANTAETLFAEGNAKNVPTYAAASGNVGNGTLSGLANPGGRYGNWTLVATSSTQFNVIDPTKVQQGTATVGTPASVGGVSFTINAGSTAFAAGDTFTLAVSGIYSWHVGTYYLPNTVQDEGTYDFGNATYSYFDAGNHSQDSYHDDSTSNRGVHIGGYKSGTDLDLSGQAVTATNIRGSYAAETISATDTSPVYLQIAGNHANAIIDTTADSGLSVIHAKAGQLVCFNAIYNCVKYDTSGKWLFTSNTGAAIMSLSDAGNLIIKGTLTPNGNP